MTLRKSEYCNSFRVNDASYDENIDCHLPNSAEFENALFQNLSENSRRFEVCEKRKFMNLNFDNPSENLKTN